MFPQCLGLCVSNDRAACSGFQAVLEALNSMDAVGVERQGPQSGLPETEVLDTK